MRSLRLVVMFSALALIALVCIIAEQDVPEANNPGIAPTPSLAEVTIMLDPGHGGANTGAYSYSDIPEKDYNNLLCAAVAVELTSRGFTVVYTRRPDEDVYLLPLDRAEAANRLRPDLFLSIHHNKDFFSSSTRGYSIYYSSYRPALDSSGVYITVNGRRYEQFVKEQIVGNLTHAYYRDDSGRLRVVKKYEAEFFIYDRTPCSVATESGAVARHLATGFQTLGFLKPHDGVAVEEKDFIVLRRTDVPSVIVEAGYISNQVEELLLSDAANRATIADRIADSLQDYFLKKLWRAAMQSATP